MTVKHWEASSVGCGEHATMKLNRLIGSCTQEVRKQNKSLGRRDFPPYKEIWSDWH
jgi:hypothetical protein